MKGINLEKGAKNGNDGKNRTISFKIGKDRL